MAISLLDLLGFASNRADAWRRVLGLRPGDPATGTTKANQSRDRCCGAAVHGSDHLPRPWRLDYTTSDQPVALTAAVEALRDVGVEMGTCDVRPGAAREAVVGGAVALPPWLDVPAVEYALRRAGARDVRAVPVRQAPVQGGGGPELPTRIGQHSPTPVDTVRPG